MNQIYIKSYKRLILNKKLIKILLITTAFIVWLFLIELVFVWPVREKIWFFNYPLLSVVSSLIIISLPASRYWFILKLILISACLFIFSTPYFSSSLTTIVKYPFAYFAQTTGIGDQKTASCMISGGWMYYRIFYPEPFCVHNYSDGGDSCSSSKQCSGDCIHKDFVQVILRKSSSDFICEYDTRSDFFSEDECDAPTTIEKQKEIEQFGGFACYTH